MMGAYRMWINHLEEKGLKIHGAKKRFREFEWGLSHIGIPTNIKNPLSAIIEYNKRAAGNSLSYFTPARLAEDDYELEGNVLSFSSSVTTFSDCNDLVRCRYFPSKNSESAIIVVPHWNAFGERFDAVCRAMNRLDVTSIRFTLPYHDERNPQNVSGSTLLVTSNIGLTLKLMQQSVRDILSVVNWLQYRGYKRIGIVGSSIGSCVAFLAAVHDRRIGYFLAYLMSGYFGDVVWAGKSTSHIRDSFVGHISQDDLRQCWLLNSPLPYVSKIREYNPGLDQLVFSARYDTTFLPQHTDQWLEECDRNSVSYEHVSVPCGHYSLGKHWFGLVATWHTLPFLWKARLALPFAPERALQPQTIVP